MQKIINVFNMFLDWAVDNLFLFGLITLPLLAVLVFVVLFIVVTGALTVQYKLHGLALKTLHIRRHEFGLFAWWEGSDKGHMISASEAETLILSYAASKTVKIDIDNEAQRYLKAATMEL